MMEGNAGFAGNTTISDLETWLVRRRDRERTARRSADRCFSAAEDAHEAEIRCAAAESAYQKVLWIVEEISKASV